MLQIIFKHSIKVSLIKSNKALMGLKGALKMKNFIDIIFLGIFVVAS